jgi:hypothetical protein
MSKRSRRLIRWGAGLLLAAVLWAQSYTASVRGLVTDASGAAIPGARIVIQDVNRNTEFVTVSDAVGRYVVTNLPPSSPPR